MRKWAAPQHKPNKFGSAFGLLHYCKCENGRRLSITQTNLVLLSACSIIVFALQLQMRKWAAPQHKPNKFGSAFNLLHYYKCKSGWRIFCLLHYATTKVQIFYDITPIYICIFLNQPIVVVITAEV